MTIRVAASATYVAVLAVAGMYYRTSKHPLARTEWYEALILANGWGSLVYFLLFTWALPEYMKLPPVYPDPATVASIVLAFWYSQIAYSRSRPRVPSPRTPTSARHMDQASG